MKQTYTLIESGIERGVYGMLQSWIIVDTEKWGRLFARQGFGGVDSMAGGAYRWSHGTVYKLRQNDTSVSLQEVRVVTNYGDTTDKFLVLFDFDTAQMAGYEIDNTLPSASIVAKLVGAL